MEKRILYLGPSGIGDWCFIYSSLLGVSEKYRCDKFDLILPYRNAGNELLRHNEWIASLGYLNRKTKGFALLGYILRLLCLLIHIRRQGYSAIAISYLSNQPDFLVLALLSGVKIRIGRITRYSWLERKAITKPIPDSEMLDKVSIHRQYGIPDWETSAAKRPLVSPQLLADACHVRRRFGLSASYVVLGIGGGRNAEWRFWPAEHYRALTDLCPEFTFVLLGGGEIDQRQARSIVCSFNTERVVNLVGKTTMGEAVSLIAEAEAVIGNDSGIANLACVLDRPTLCLYGPTDYKLTGPALLGAKVLSANIACRPCFGDDQNATEALTCAHHQCLQEISPIRVSSELRALISKQENILNG